MSDVLVDVEGVSKKFCRTLKRSLWYGVQDIFADLNPFKENGSSVQADSLIGRNHTNSLTSDGKKAFNATTGLLNNANSLRPDEFWAVNDVSFQLKRGECLGLIGHNGAGKTTLLKMLNGLIKPDRGRISMRGKVGALIALGAGFNPILSGRENIYINASVLGLTKKETDAKLDEIIEFSGIEDFIDTPVQNYSSGMQVRLGFAVATAIEPEILLLDEVLAVGDMAFRIKCYNRIGRLQKQAATILVTHDMSYLSTVCNRILFMSSGRGNYYSDRNLGIQKYIAAQTPASGQDSEPLLTFSLPLRSASISVEPQTIQHGEDLAIRIVLDSSADMREVQLRCTALTDTEQTVMFWDSDWIRQPINLRRGSQIIRLVLGPICLISGQYWIYFSLLHPGNSELLFYSHRTVGFQVTGRDVHSDVHTTFGVKHLNMQYDNASIC
jgi:lipopolysaccharide transport system ATP-binding protein